jgi:hypothetical protein
MKTIKACSVPTRATIIFLGESTCAAHPTYFYHADEQALLHSTAGQIIAHFKKSQRKRAVACIRQTQMRIGLVIVFVVAKDKLFSLGPFRTGGGKNSVLLKTFFDYEGKISRRASIV